MWSAPEIEVFALAVASDGDVFAGTSPNGKVYRIDNKGQHEVYFDPEQTYIWSLAFAQDPGKDKAPDLFVGTGDKGKIYRVTSRGKGELYYESGQRHVVSLAFDGQGRLLAGTDPNGILYRIESKRKAFALYDSDMPEIRNLQVTSGRRYFRSRSRRRLLVVRRRRRSLGRDRTGRRYHNNHRDRLSRKRPQSRAEARRPNQRDLTTAERGYRFATRHQHSRHRQVGTTAYRQRSASRESLEIRLPKVCWR